MTFSLFPYVGGKSELAGWIRKHLPGHSCYVEPYAGSASVLFNKPRSKVEVINDLDGDIIQFYEVCRDRDQELKNWLQDVPYSRELYNDWASEFYAGERVDDPIERAGRFLYLRYSSWGGKYGHKAGFKRASHLNEQPPSKIWVKVPERVDVARERLRGVEIECLDALEIINRYDSDESVFYVDPPYLEANDEYYVNHEMNHSALESTLRGIDGFFLVSYNGVPDCFDRNQYWVFERGFTQRSKRGMERGHGHDNRERLVLNFDPRVTSTFVSEDSSQSTLTEVQ